MKGKRVKGRGPLKARITESRPAPLSASVFKAVQAATGFAKKRTRVR